MKKPSRDGRSNRVHRNNHVGLNELSQQGLYAQDIVNTLRESLLVLDASLKIVYANPSFYRTFRVKVEEAVGRYLYDLGNRQWNIDSLHELLEGIIPKNKSFENYEVRHCFPVIGDKVMLLNARKIRHKDGELILLLIDDVTERKKAEDAVQDSEEKYNTLVESINSIIIGINSSGEITFFNNFSEKLFKYPREEVLGRKIVPSIIPEKESNGKDNSNLIQNMVRRPEEFYFQKSEGICKDHSRVIFSWSLRKLEGDPIFEYLIDGNDISEEEKIQQEAADYRQQIQAKTEEALKSKRLVDLGTLASTVSHELRNPLSTMQIAVHNIKRKIHDEAIEKNLEAIENKIVDSGRIINNLLAYSRLNSPQYQNVSLCSIVHEAVNNLKERSRHEDNLEIKEVCSCETQDMIDIDPDLMRQVFLNVLNNAMDAVSPINGKIRVSIDCVNKNAVIKISDNGSGIAEQEKEKIFEPFFTRKLKGTGLGLSVTRNIVEMHHGKIEVDSREGDGTTFVITLPLKRADDNVKFSADF
ncbi:MAG: ATP-binding protein [Candidatus Omnitrophota bacterium]